MRSGASSKKKNKTFRGEIIMELNAYCIVDSKGKFFNLPFFVRNVEIAKRSFSDLVRNPQTDIGRHPEDYTLFYVGKFDDSSGSLKGETPQSVCNGLEYVGIENISDKLEVME